jgi:hypothetical protein
MVNDHSVPEFLLLSLPRIVPVFQLRRGQLNTWGAACDTAEGYTGEDSYKQAGQPISWVLPVIQLKDTQARSATSRLVSLYLGCCL